MEGYNTDKKYESFKIPDRHQVQKDGLIPSSTEVEPSAPVLQKEDLFYEIDYDSYPIPGVGKYVLKQRVAEAPEKIEVPEKDEIRELFHQMRDIERAHRSSVHYSRFFDRRVQNNQAIIFYQQGLFMKDFCDNYSDNSPFSHYFPNYQMMNYEQLRTYFTWRTEVRKGNVSDTSLSYAFLYIYELLSNIGVNSPQDGLDKLMFFWKAFNNHNHSIDKYILRWLKDYHIYYKILLPFNEFIKKNNLASHYPKIADDEDNFHLFCAISKYDIRKSTFFTSGNEKLMTDCFHFVINKLRQVFIDNGIHFDESIFHPTKKMTVWEPFEGALFYEWMRQPDRRIVLSENEIYVCSKNKWTFCTVITNESGRELLGYVMKQMEAGLRKMTKYKHKLSANISTVKHAMISKLNEKGQSLENIVNSAVIEFYRETTKTIIKVNHQALSQIRQEALATQEKLIVPDQIEASSHIPAEQEQLGTSASLYGEESGSSSLLNQEKLGTPLLTNQEELNLYERKPLNQSLITTHEISTIPIIEKDPLSMPDIWQDFKKKLTKTEIQALSVLLYREVDIKKFAVDCDIMLEVLVDGINQKAMDSIGDNLMDEEFILYDDYKEQVKELVG